MLKQAVFQHCLHNPQRQSTFDKHLIFTSAFIGKESRRVGMVKIAMVATLQTHRINQLCLIFRLLIRNIKECCRVIA